MECWICGDQATTKEHKFKVSDLVQHIGQISEVSPIVRWPDGKRKQYVKSKKSPKLTFETLICASCNNKRTQPYDKAWEVLSNYFYKNREQIIGRGQWEPKKVFPGSSKKALINVHLYFLKWFGCKSKDFGVPLDYSVLADNILSGTPNSNFYLKFGNTPGLPVGTRYALETPMQVLEHTNSGSTHSAFTYYLVGQISIEAIYTLGTNDKPEVIGTWSPLDRKKKFIYYRTRYAKI
jgi:hypothetical protein